MAGAMLAAAALGFAGSHATSFVLAPGTSSSTVATASALTLRGAQQTTAASAAPSASGASSAMFCSSVAAGLVGAASKMGRKAERGSRACRAAALDASKEVGAMAPLGYWDPCGLMKERVGAEGAQWKDEAVFEKYRTAELKHGRVAMLAATGLLTNVVWKFQGFDLVPQGVDALQDEKGGAGFGIIFILAAWFELNYPKGNFPDPLNLGKAMDENMDSLRAKELNNGRIGMMATITLLMYNIFENKLPSEMVYHTTLSAGTLPAVVAFLVLLPMSSQVWGYDSTKAKASVPVTIKAELPKATEEVKESATTTA